MARTLQTESTNSTTQLLILPLQACYQGPMDTLFARVIVYSPGLHF
ncbi:unnamed protein product [Protopolystoma xenopodis]|uniref:Uncharacterized protein n=1 Tax=Protopolystoma xenopodis TaxID=117903 RepID=A0A448X9T5_9PLAT|nr:unnamed protein product [Protopolystoma xenopodis]